MKKPARPDPNTSHLAGEYFVAAELSKRGWAVAMTIGNAKAIDLFVEKGRCTVNIQIKSISRKKNVGWPMTKSKVWSNVIYVFVCLNELDEPPSFFIARPPEIRPRIKQYRTRGILNFGSVNSPQFCNRWDKIELAIQKARTTKPAATK
ncbi:MAG: hypothetical protein C5B50_02010 [Verrucomicrobia bacterium]|nr:MAG: hypothetical protein C5B50_02010 [Verrucomicrobiota bacterium]